MPVCHLNITYISIPIDITGENNVKMQMITSIIAVEVHPGQLLKATTDTCPEKVAMAARDGDVRNMCGHLVSLVIANKGLENTPLALLANHVQTALLTMQAATSGHAPPGAPGYVHRGSAAAGFVLECLVTLPKVIVAEIASKVGIASLGR